MLETMTPSNPASCESFVNAAAVAGSACLSASSTVATSSLCPRRVSRGRGITLARVVVPVVLVVEVVVALGEVEPAPVVVEPVDVLPPRSTRVSTVVLPPRSTRVSTVVLAPPPSVKPIATPATAAAPASARTGPFHFTGGETNCNYACCR
jgi:hypothetical protein